MLPALLYECASEGKCYRHASGDARQPGVFTICRMVFTVHRTVLIVRRTLLTIHRTVLTGWRTVLT